MFSKDNLIWTDTSGGFLSILSYREEDPIDNDSNKILDIYMMKSGGKINNVNDWILDFLYHDFFKRNFGIYIAKYIDQNEYRNFFLKKEEAQNYYKDMIWEYITKFNNLKAFL